MYACPENMDVDTVYVRTSIIVVFSYG